MKETKTDRRRFIKDATNTLGGMALLSTLPIIEHADAVKYASGAKAQMQQLAPRIKFAVIGINHGHIHSLIDIVVIGGGVFVSFYAKEAALAADFAKRYPQVKVAQSDKEILEDNSIQLVVSAAIPEERASIGIAAMRHGKDFMVDKPGITTIEHLTEVRKVQQETGRIYSIAYGRMENPASLRAGELVKAGAIGKVIQTIALAPHRMNIKTRPNWFFDVKHYGGIINDIGSHQFDEFLFFTGSTSAKIIASQAGNVHHPQYPAFQDFGDAIVTGNRGTGYLRVDWFTPDGLKSWGDDRITILGTNGYIEIRKNLDIAGREGEHHLFLVDQKETRYFNCSNQPLPYGKNLVDDIINRTQTAMSQEHCFLATELGLRAQEVAQHLKV
ncbi:MAG: Gfo/Idh/MocA family oxidoreductase [Chitinophagaceae bacterium]